MISPKGSVRFLLTSMVRHTPAKIKRDELLKYSRAYKRIYDYPDTNTMVRWQIDQRLFFSSTYSFIKYYQQNYKCIVKKDVTFNSYKKLILKNKAI